MVVSFAIMASLAAFVGDLFPGFQTPEEKMPKLEFYQNGNLFLNLKLQDRSVTLGRSNECDVTLADPKVSRVHAMLAPDGDFWKLENRGMNGTRVNSELVTGTKRLQVGDRIYIESYTIVFSEMEVAPTPDDDETTRTTIALRPFKPQK